MTPVASELSHSAAAEAKVLVRPVEADALITDSQQVCVWGRGGGAVRSHRQQQVALWGCGTPKTIK